MTKKYYCRGWLKIHFRSFNSKRAVLVLVWCLLTTIAHRILYFILVALDKEEETSYAVSGTAISVLLVTPFFGWLADAKLGNYRVVKIGIGLSLTASVLVSLFSLLNYNTSLSSNQNMGVRTALLVGIYSTGQRQSYL